MARNAIESEFRSSKMADQWPEMRSKVIFRHPTWPPKKILYLSEMARIASGSEFRKSKWLIDLKWPEMRSKVNFGHPKLSPADILSKIKKKIKVAYRSEMARNAIEGEIRTSKMADASHFVKKCKQKLKLRIDVKWIEMRSKVIFGHPKWPLTAIL